MKHIEWDNVLMGSLLLLVFVSIAIVVFAVATAPTPEEQIQACIDREIFSRAECIAIYTEKSQSRVCVNAAGSVVICP